MQIDKKKKFVVAIPKGRILSELFNIFTNMNLTIEKDFFETSSRKLKFSTVTNDKKLKLINDNLEIIRVRSQDVATFVSMGVADLGVCGNDIILERNYPNLYIPLNLSIGICKMVLAQNKDDKNIDLELLSHIDIATKYPNITKNYFENLGITAHTIYLSGASEIAPALKLAPYIVDITSSGQTLKQNNLKVVLKIADIYSCLVVNRVSYKLYKLAIQEIINMFANSIK